MQTQINPENGQIAIRGPYSHENNARYKTLGGKFKDGAWLVPDTDTARLTLAEMFGEKSEAGEYLVPYEKTGIDNGIVQLGGYVLAQRRDRDGRVQMPLGVSLHTGKFHSSGGSRANPRVNLPKDVVFRLVCRKSFAEKHGLFPVPTAAPVVEI